MSAQTNVNHIKCSFSVTYRWLTWKTEKKQHIPSRLRLISITWHTFLRSSASIEPGKFDQNHIKFCNCVSSKWYPDEKISHAKTQTDNFRCGLWLNLQNIMQYWRINDSPAQSKHTAAINNQGKRNKLLYPDKDFDPYNQDGRIECNSRLGGVLRYYHRETV